MKKVKKASNHHVLTPYLMIFPVYSIYIIFIFFPIINTFVMSFTDYDLGTDRNFVGFKNYLLLFEDKLFLTALKNTAVYAVFTVTLQLSLGVLLANILNSKLVKCLSFSRMANYIPHITSMVAVSMVWLYLLDPMSSGIFNQLLALVGLPPSKWLSDIDLALPMIIIISVWKSLGYTMTVYLAGLQQIPGPLYEAAKIDGAGAVRRFFNITLPLLSPTTFFLLVTSCISAFNVFEQVNIMTNGGPVNTTTTIVHQIYNRAFINLQMGYASAMAVLLILITLVLTLINFKMGNRGTDLSL